MPVTVTYPIRHCHTHLRTSFVRFPSPPGGYGVPQFMSCFDHRKRCSPVCNQDKQKESNEKRRGKQNERKEMKKEKAKECNKETQADRKEGRKEESKKKIRERERETERDMKGMNPR